MKDIIFSYIDNYDFNQSFNWFLTVCDEQKFAELRDINEDTNLKDFCVDYWDSPDMSATDLKEMYSIRKGIGFSDILKIYHCETYHDFLKKCWSKKYSIDDLVEEYGRTYSDFNKLILPIILNDNDVHCPRCLDGHYFFVEGNLSDIRNDNLRFICRDCDSLHKIDSLISKDIADYEKHLLKTSEDLILEEIENINKNILPNLKCYKCQSHNISAEIKKDKSQVNYHILCSDCNNTWDSIDNFQSEYKAWEQRAAMMIKIKAHEEELINKALSRKKSSEIKFINNELIGDDDFNKGDIYFLLNVLDNNKNPWVELFEKIKKCNRMDMKILIEIIDILKDNGTEKKWRFDEAHDINASFLKYNIDEPLVVYFFKKTGILNIRSCLRNLMNNSLISCGEDTNFIQTSKLLIDNYDKLVNLLKPQNIENDIKHLILKRDNFTCTHCGESGRPLKVAFLSSKKDMNVLSDMASICDICFESVVENEVLIDGSVLGESGDDYKNIVSWKFISSYFPQLDSEDSTYHTHLKLIEKYGEESLIKALAISLSKRDEKKFKTISIFYNYTTGILRNSEGRVYISNSVSEEYNVQSLIDYLHN